MKKLVIILLSCIVLGACSVSPVNEESKGAVRITLPGGSRALTNTISSYSIDIKNESGGYSNDITAEPGQTITIDNLKPDTYKITIKGYDPANTEVVNGTTTVQVKAGKVTPAQIQLVYSSGSINVEILLPEDNEEPDNKSYRPKKQGYNLYTYNEKGFITRIDTTNEWRCSYEVYTLNEDGSKRIGSEYYAKYGSDEEYEIKYYAEISHDDQGRENQFKYYNKSDDKPCYEILIEFSDNGRKETRYDYWHTVQNEIEVSEKKIFYVKEFDEIGRHITDEYYSDILWGWYNDFIIDDGNIIKGVYEYYNNSWKRTNEKMFLNGELFLETNILFTYPEVFKYGYSKTPNGILITELHFGALFKDGDKYGQPATKSVIEHIPNNIPLYYPEKKSKVTKWTEMYNSNFEGCGTYKHPYANEEGIYAEGQSNIHF